MVNRKKTYKSIAWGAVGLLVVIVSILGIIIYQRLFSPNVATGRKSPQFILIPTGSRFEDLVQMLNSEHLLIDEKSFRWTAAQMHFVDAIKPGRYQLKPRMTNKELITLLRSGKQIPVHVIFNNIRTKEQLAMRVSEQIEAHSTALLNLMNDPDYTRKLGFTPDNILAIFLPNTYDFYWNTSADQFLQRMKKEYDKFWTGARLNLGKQIGFTPIQVSILASIVQQESNRADEKPVIAGVYINRIRKNWKLEADPTLVYALGDFTINRVLRIFKNIVSPYNTYMYAGLPPGPICLPTGASIDAVLNYTKHNYLFFCAKEDFSGYHAFASSYEKHIVNARRFQKALDRRGIKS